MIEELLIVVFSALLRLRVDSVTELALMVLLSMASPVRLEPTALEFVKSELLRLERSMVDC